MISLSAALAVFVLLNVANPINSRAIANDIGRFFNSLGEQTHETGQIMDEATEEIIPTDSNKNKEKKPSNYRFILMEPDKSFGLENFVEFQVFFYSANSTQTIASAVTQFFSEIEANKKKGIQIQDILYGEEEHFKAEVEKYIDMEYMDNWYKVAPSSDELDEYIFKRKELNKSAVGDRQGCYELWWRLANDYQYYAMEYETQTNNESAVLYYYSMSIYCCMEALKYEMNQGTYNRIYHYMVMRYHDIYRDECMISRPYKNMARCIYEALESYEIYP